MAQKMSNELEQLSAEKERYRVIAELTSDYAYSLRADSETKVVLDWANGAYSRLTGLGETDLHRGVTQARWIKTAHTTDRAAMQKRVDTLLSGESITTEYKIVSKTGETRWLRDIGRPILDDDGRVIRIYCAAQDITEDMRKAELIEDRTLDPKALCGNLRKFRHKLKLSQKVFGQTFGEYSQRQITSYETGESEIPLGLLLRIRDAGYPLDVVLGEGKTTALDQVVGYLAASARAHDKARQSAQSICDMLANECQTIKDIMRELGLPDDLKNGARMRRRRPA